MSERGVTHSFKRYTKFSQARRAGYRVCGEILIYCDSLSLTATLIATQLASQ